MNIAMPVQSRPRSERSPSLSKKGLGGRFIPILEQHYELRKGGLRPNDLSDVLARHNQNVKHKRDSAPDILTEMREKEMKEKREAALRHKAKEMEDLRRVSCPSHVDLNQDLYMFFADASEEVHPAPDGQISGVRGSGHDGAVLQRMSYAC